MKERHILWADAEHIEIWASSFVFLSRNGYAITLLTSLADESSRTQMQNALEIHVLNLAHATAEKQRLEQIGTLPPIVDAQIESARAEIRKLEEKLFQ